MQSPNTCDNQIQSRRDFKALPTILRVHWSQHLNRTHLCRHKTIIIKTIIKFPNSFAFHILRSSLQMIWDMGRLYIRELLIGWQQEYSPELQHTRKTAVKWSSDTRISEFCWCVWQSFVRARQPKVRVERRDKWRWHQLYLMIRHRFRLKHSRCRVCP